MGAVTHFMGGAGSGRGFTQNPHTNTTPVYVEYNLQELCDQFRLLRKPLLEEHHHPCDQLGHLSEGGQGVERRLQPRANPLINYPSQSLQHLHIL